MSSTILNREATHVEIEIPIASEALEQAQDRVFRELVKSVKLPGFRPGHVPRRVYEQTYGSHTLHERAMEEVMPELYAQAVREHDLEPIERPHLRLLPEEPGKPTRVLASVEVRPEITLGVYRGLPIEGEDASVSDEDLERSLMSLAKERATLVPVDRPAALGDVVTLDYTGSVDGLPFEGGSAQGAIIDLLEVRFIPGFASGIAGMSAGTSREVAARFPDEYAASELAGKEAVFSVTLHDVKEFELPRLDDAFAAAVSEKQSMAELRAEIVRRLEMLAQARVRRLVGGRVMEALLAQHDFALPQSLVEREIDRMLGDLSGELERAGSTLEQFLRDGEKTQESLRESMRDEAKNRVKGILLIEAIGKAESVSATPAELQIELEVLAARYGQPVDRVRSALANNIGALLEGIVRNKTLDLLIDAAEVSPPLPKRQATETTAP